MSLSQPEPDPRLDAAVAFATAHGSLVVASAGNRATSGDKRDVPRYPAASPGALGVGAVDGNDRVAGDSVRGRHVDVVGIGDPVITAYARHGDCLVQGQDVSTSMATGYVSAVAALVVQAYPAITPAELVYRLEVSADRPVLGARDDARGWGLVQPLDAVTLTLDPARPGPPVPGGRQAPRAVALAQHIQVVPVTDPARAQKRDAIWWLLAGAVAVALAVLGGQWVAVRRGSSSP